MKKKNKQTSKQTNRLIGGGGGECSGKNGPDYEMYFVKPAKESKSHGGLNDRERKRPNISQMGFLTYQLMALWAPLNSFPRQQPCIQ